MFVVKWETLNGNIRTQKFASSAGVDEFADKVANRPGTQWVDIEQI